MVGSDRSDHSMTNHRLKENGWSHKWLDCQAGNMVQEAQNMDAESAQANDCNDGVLSAVHKGEQSTPEMTVRF
jgi:hypothetical protein